MSIPTITKDDLVLRIHLNEQLQNFDQMVEYATMLATKYTLNQDERYMVWASYKNSIGKRRVSWKALQNHLPKATDPDEAQTIIAYMKKIEKEMDALIDKVINLLDTTLIPTSTNDEYKCFYMKMKSDNLRYKSEYLSGEESVKNNVIAEESYKSTYQHAVAHLSKSDPTRLSIGLNAAMFYYQILKNPDKAKEIAYETINNGIEELDLGLLNAEEATYRKSVLKVIKEMIINCSTPDVVKPPSQ